MSYLSEQFIAIRHQISVNYLKKMVLSVFTNKISGKRFMSSNYERIVSIQKRNTLQFRTKVTFLQCEQFLVVQRLLSFQALKKWELIADEMKELESLLEFKRAVKLQKPTPVLADYANNILIVLVLFNKVFCFINVFLQHKNLFCLSFWF